MTSLLVKSDTSSSYGGTDDSGIANETKCDADMDVENLIPRFEMDNKKHPKSVDVEESMTLCGKQLHPNEHASQAKTGVAEIAIRSSDDVQANVPEDTHNSTDNCGEPDRSDEIPSKLIVLTEEKDVLVGKHKEIDIEPNDLSISKSCFNSVAPQTTESAESHIPSKPVSHNVKKIDQSAMESDKVITNSENKCHVVNGNQIDVKGNDTENYCESPKCVNTELKNSGFNENEADHDVSLKNNRRTISVSVRSENSESVTVSKQHNMNEISNECDTNSGQQKNIHSKRGKSYSLKENSSGSDFCEEILPNIENERIGNDELQKFVDYNGENKNVEIESVAETLNSNFAKTSVEESTIQNISDLKVNGSTEILNQMSQDTVPLSLKEKEEELVNCVSLKEYHSKSTESSPKKTSLFLRGSFPRIAMRDTGGMATIRRLQRQLLREREKREMAASGYTPKKRSVKENTPKKDKNTMIGMVEESYSKSVETMSYKETKMKHSTNYPKLKNLQVSLERIDEKMLIKYKVDLRNLHVSAAVNKISNENLQLLKATSEASNFNKNKIKNLEHLTQSHLQNENTVGIQENTGLPIQEVDEKIPVKKQTQLKSHNAKLKHLRVCVLKIDDSTLSKYGYGPQKLKSSSSAIITHQRTGGEEILNKEKTNHLLNVNDVKYPAQILLSKIDITYPNILKQTLKLNMNNKNKSSKNNGVKKKSKVSPKIIISDSCNDLKTIQISEPQNDEALSKSGSVLKSACNGSKTRPEVDAKGGVAVKSSDVHPLDIIHSQEKMAKKRKADSFNDVKDSKENLCLTGDSWVLKHARVSLQKLDNSVLPKFLPSAVKINSK